MMEKQTIVVKVGTSSLTLSDGTMDAEKIRNITTQLAALQTAGHHVILVSSGAIAAGFSRLGFKKRPTKIADKQAAAAVGQGLLMEEYTKNLMAYQIPCAQILLNRSDFEDRRRYKNIFGSLSVLLGRGAIPIINENDTIAIEELKVGDNDTLSAQVAAMLHASLLILLTDIDGLYTANPKSDPNAGGQQLLPQGNHIREIQIVDLVSAIVAGSTGVIQPAAQIDHCRAGVVFQVRLHFKGKVILPHGDLQRTETLHQAVGILLCLRKVVVDLVEQPNRCFVPVKVRVQFGTQLPGIQWENQRLLHGVFLDFVFHRFLPQ